MVVLLTFFVCFFKLLPMIHAGVLATESAFNKPIKFKITTSMRAKAAALMAFTPDCNGNGKFINLN